MIFTLANDHFIAWPSSVTLNLPERMFQMNKCAKLFWNPCINVDVMAWTSSIMTTASVTWPLTYLNKSFKWTTVPNYFEIHAKLLKLWSRKIWMDRHRHAQCTHAQGTHIHRTKIVTTMSCSSQVGWTKIELFLSIDQMMYFKKSRWITYGYLKIKFWVYGHK